jgi:hypothetical protein
MKLFPAPPEARGLITIHKMGAPVWSVNKWKNDSAGKLVRLILKCFRSPRLSVLKIPLN